MQAKIDTLRVKDDSNDEYLLYPKTLMQCVTDEDGNTLANELSDIKAQLPANIDARFLTAEGYGGLRYYAGVFQSYDELSATWVDIQPTDDNALILNLAPQPMQKMFVSSDVDAGHYKITFKEPVDTVLDGQLLVCVEGVKFVRKLGSEPASVEDGILVLDYSRRKFSNYAQTSFLDETFTPNAGENWFYKAFPYSTNGFVGESTMNVAQCVFKDYWLFGFKLDQNESDPASMITYLEDCDNAYYQSAYMDYNSGSFNYGDWADAWFIRDLKPVMLKYDGTVGYELMKSDYTLKADGTASDVANTSYAGNAMMGIPKVYWKIVDNGDDTANIYIASKQVDSGFHCWSHIDNNGKEIDYCYMPVYNGSLISSKLRSISGQRVSNNLTRTNEVTYAKANNTTGNVIWYTEVYSDRQLINLLLLLIGRSTDAQAVFGAGNYYVSSQTNLLSTGTMDDKGLFWGGDGSTYDGVKVFGMEHWWGSVQRPVAGWIYNKGVHKIKMTYGTADGSTANEYNLTGDGYMSLDVDRVSGTNDTYITKLAFDKHGLIPIKSDGSSSTYFPDAIYYNNTYVAYALMGGQMTYTSTSDNRYKCGPFRTNLQSEVGNIQYHIGASLSCKPLATT